MTYLAETSTRETGPFAGVLLDLDGTLVDSIAVVERSWARWCGEYGIDPHRLSGLHGVTAASVVAAVLPEPEREAALARIVAIEDADTEGIVVLPGAEHLLHTLATAEVPTAVVTSGTRGLAEGRLAAAGLPRPVVLVTASDVTRGKPAPDPWLLGAELLGVDPRECLVVEDSVAGLRAARAAGCRTLVGVLGTAPRAELAEIADVVVPDLSHLVVDASEGLVRATVST
ncbi:MAG: HAD-IA family hydrolase [Phycicoccus sp.]